MKKMTQILLFAFITFLFTPTIVSVIEKGVDKPLFYNFSEVEKSNNEIKAVFVFGFDYSNTTFNLSKLSAGIIRSENLSIHDKITSTIFIPPPEQV